MIAGMRESLLRLEADPSFVMTTLLRRGAIKNAKALIHAAQVLKEDKLLTRPAPATMQVYNSPLQGNGNRLGLGSKAGHLEIKRTPMEGYVVGVKSQTLYWCVLDGPRLLWYAEPTRRTTVAQTWLDGCRIIGLGNGVLEIQSPTAAPTTSGATAAKTIASDEEEEPEETTPPPQSAPLNTNGDEGGGTEEDKKEGEGVTEPMIVSTAAAAAVEPSSATSATLPSAAEAEPTPALCVVENTADPPAPSSTKVAVATPDVRIEAGGGNGESGVSASENPRKEATTSKEDAAATPASAAPVCMSVRLEVKDETQYQQWLQSLKEASMYGLRDRSLWRKCFR